MEKNSYSILIMMQNGQQDAIIRALQEVADLETERKAVSQYNVRVCWTDPIFIKAGTYTFKCSSGFGFCYLNIFKTFDDASSGTNRIAQPVFGNNVSYTYTFASDMYVRYQQNETSGTAEAYALVSSSWQTELGSTATAYEPYTGNTYPISWQTEAGTVYGGTLTVNKDGSGVVKVTMASRTLNGTEDWDKSATPNDHWRFATSLSDAKMVGLNDYGVISDTYPAKTPANTYTAQTGVSLNTSTSTLFICDETYTTKEDFATALQTNNVQVVYELATPVTYNLTNLEVIETLKGVNNVWSDGGNCAVEYSCDTKLYIDKKLAETIANLN